MKTKNQFNLIRGTLIIAPLFLLSGCSYFGLYSEGRFEEIGAQSHQLGYDQGVSDQGRKYEHERQRVAAEKQTREEFHTVYVPAHVNEHGVKIEGHHVPIKILVEN